MSAAGQGILVLDHGETPVLATGLGKNTEIQGALIDIWKSRAETEIKKLFVLTLAQKAFDVASLISSDAACFLISKSESNDELTHFLAAVDYAPDIFRYFLTNPYEAMNVVDPSGKVLYLSPIHERSLGLQRGEAIGRPVGEVIRNTG